MRHFRIVAGDAREVLATLPAESVQCVVTSPPYWGLRDYGVQPGIWGGSERCAHAWGSVLPPKPGPGNRVVSPKSSLTNPGTHFELRRAGNSGAFCSRCRAWRGCLGLEPTPRLYVRHLVAVLRAVKRVLRKDGTLWLNLGDSYAGGGRGPDVNSTLKGSRESQEQSRAALRAVGQPRRPPDGLKVKDLVGIPWRVAFALQKSGWWLRSDVIWAKPNPMPESIEDRPTRAHEYLFLLTKSDRYFYDKDAIAEPAVEEGSGNANRRLDEAGKRARRGTHLGSSVPWSGETRNKRTVWTITTRPFAGAHFAVMPEPLVEPCILAGSGGGGGRA